MMHRYDVSRLPLQVASVARQYPVQAQKTRAVVIEAGGSAVRWRPCRRSQPKHPSSSTADSGWAGAPCGRPDLLVAAEASGYRAIDVKWHSALEGAGPSASITRALVSPYPTHASRPL
jgi:hypothetical protein